MSFGRNWHDAQIREVENRVEKMEDHEVLTLAGVGAEEFPGLTERDVVISVRRELRRLIRERRRYRAASTLIDKLLARPVERGKK